jgi:FkbM family methyltransferase
MGPASRWTYACRPSAVRSGRVNGTRIEILARLLSRDSVIVDVGANIGFYTIGLAVRLPAARVYAFEPIPSNLMRLRENIEANALGSRVRVIEIALGAAPGVLHLMPERGYESTGNAAPAAPDAKGAVCVSLSALDLVAAELELDLCDLLKVDVEGAELRVLQGGARLRDAGAPRHRP